MRVIQTDSDPNDDLIAGKKLPSPEPLLEKNSIIGKLLKDFLLTDQEIKSVVNSKWLVPNLIIQGHMTALVAEPNGGKTSLCLHLASEIASNGEQVIYMNADTSGGDGLRMREKAIEDGWHMILPDIKVGKTVDDFIDWMKELSATHEKVSNLVIFIDTLKKCTNMIQKDKAKDFFKLLRSLTGRGATVVALAHTNKYRDNDGRPIYEGTGDIRADFDELIYLIPDKQQDGSMIVSSLPDKWRCQRIEPVSYRIDAQRNVQLEQEFVDTLASRKKADRREKDSFAIHAIQQAIQAKQISQTDIAKHCHESAGIGRRKVLGVLKFWDGDIWKSEPGFQHNSIFYKLI